MASKLESPWDVDSLYVFRYFNCPSCSYTNGSKQDFVYHTFKNHQESTDYFRNISDGSLNDILLPWEFEDDKSKLELIHDNDCMEFQDFRTIQDKKNSDHKKVDKLQEFQNGEIITIKTEDIVEEKEKYLQQSNKLNDEEEEYNVERIIDKHYDINGQVFYLVKWKGYQEKDNTWEPIENLYCENLIEEFEIAYEANDDFVDNEHPNDEETHLGEKVHQKFGTSKQLTRHGKLHDKKHSILKSDVNYKCHLCKYGKFSLESELKKHIYTNHEMLKGKLQKSDKGYKCELCPDKYYNKRKYLREHIYKYHDEGHKEGHIDYKCESCGKSFSQKQTLRNHIHTIHEGHKDYKCETCGKSFAERGTLAKHIRIIHEGVKESFQCTQCAEIFTSWYSRKNHILRVHEGTLPPKPERKKRPRPATKDCACETCGKLFYDNNTLIQHIKKLHNILEKNHMCPVCKKTFWLKQNLEKHSLKFCGNFDRKFDNTTQITLKCELCKSETIFPTLAKLKYHIYHQCPVRKEKQISICDNCGKKCLNPTKLREHKDIVHKENPLRYSCDVCGKEFYIASMLRKHKNVHEGRKDYVCPTCGAAFVSIFGMRRHNNTVHEGRKDHKCDFCEETRTTSTSLKKHIIKFHLDKALVK